MTAPTTMQISGFRGDVIAPNRNGYDEARAVWNGTVDRRPRLIARCSGTADVSAAVRFARDRDLEIAVRGGGHNVAGTAVCDDGIVIDLSAMRAVTVDPVERTARRPGRRPVGRRRPRDTGTRSGHHGRHREPHRRRRRHPGRRHRLAHAQTRARRRQPGGGRAGHRRGRASSGHRPTITPTCSGRCEAAAATSASSARSGSRCTPSAPPSWPDRCSGRPRTPPTYCASTVNSSPTRPTSSATSFGWARSRRGQLSARTCTSGRPSPSPAATPDPSKTVSVRSVRSASSGRRSSTCSHPRRTSTFQGGIDDTVPHGWHYYWKSTNLTGLSDEVIDVIAEHAYGAGSPRSYAVMFHLGGAVARVPHGRHRLRRSRRGAQHRHRRRLAP